MASSWRERVRLGAAEVFGFDEVEAQADMMRARLQEASADARMLSRAIEDVDWNNLGGTNQGPYLEPTPVTRREDVRAAYLYYVNDPIVGRTIDLRTNYAFSKDVDMPLYRDEIKDQDTDVDEPDPGPGQAIVSKFWKDPFNQKVIFGEEAQRVKETERQLQANIFLLLLPPSEQMADDEDESLRGAGAEPDVPTRVADLPQQEIVDIVMHPGNRKIPLYYKRQYTARVYDFEAGVYGPGESKAVYYRDWRFAAPTVWNGKPWGPSVNQIAKGFVYHIASNRTSEMKFGVSETKRYIKWARGLNEYMHSRMNLVQALSQVAMRAKVAGGPKHVQQIAGTLQQLQRVSSGIEGATSSVVDSPWDQQAAQNKTKISVENAGVDLQPMVADTNSGNALNDINTLKSQVAAGSGVPAHHLGGTGDANLASATCYDEETETLTEEGWMGLEALKQRDKAGTLPRIAAYDIEADRIVYQHALSGLKLYPYKGEMVRFASRSQDMLVTPNHRMLVRKGSSLGAAQPFEFIEAGALGRSRYYVKTAARLSDDRRRVEEFVLPSRPMRQRLVRTEHRALEIVALHARGHDQQTIARKFGISQASVSYALKGRPRRTERPAIRMAMDAWLEWLGLYIAEGSSHGSSGGQVCQSTASAEFARVKEVCDALGVPARETVKVRKGETYAPRWYWTPQNPTQFKVWLDEHVGSGCAEKRIPEFVFTLPAEQQMCLLRGLMLGDGHAPAGWETQGSSTYWTTSPQLADDVQRLAVHCGFRVRQRSEDRQRPDRRERKCYVINLMAGVAKTYRSDYGALPKPERVAYDGEVYCFALPTTTIITRRGDRQSVALQGQSMDAPLQRLCDATQRLWRGVYRDLCGYELTRNGMDPARLSVKMPPVLSWDVGVISQAVIGLIAAVDPNISNRELVRWCVGQVLSTMNVENVGELLDDFFPEDWISPMEQTLMIGQAQQAMAAGGAQSPAATDQANMAAIGAADDEASGTPSNTASYDRAMQQHAVSVNRGRRTVGVRQGAGNAIQASAQRAQKRYSSAVAAPSEGATFEARLGELIESLPAELREAGAEALAGLDDAYTDH